jgi:hypothetical protein
VTSKTLVLSAVLGSAAAALAPMPYALADDKPSVVIWPTLEPAGDAGTAPLHRPQPTPDKNLFDRAQELDATLRDAVQDLGFTLYVADAGPAPGRTRDEDLVNRAARSASGEQVGGGTWVVSPRIESAGAGSYVVRVVAVAPGARELHVRVETVAAESVGARGLVMLRGLLSTEAAARAAAEHDLEETARGSAAGIMRPLRSQGRALLAVDAGLFGAYTAYSLERASGSSDPRVLYPLLALGTGIGVGAALLVADEWDVTTGDAGVLSAGALWGTVGASLIVAGSNVQPVENRYGWSVGGGLIGTALATAAITQTSMDDGDAALAHSGGVVGLLVGGAIQYLYKGTPANVTPYRGSGLGTSIGTVLAGAAATQVTVSPSRVLLIDVGIGGGVLLGAAAASPLITQGFPNTTPTRTRLWLSATMGGGVAGGVAAYFLTRDVRPDRPRAGLTWMPTLGVVGETETPRGTVPAYGLVVAGTL